MEQHFLVLMVSVSITTGEVKVNQKKKNKSILRVIQSILLYQVNKGSKDFRKTIIK